jgi:WD40 repeat protein
MNWIARSILILAVAGGLTNAQEAVEFDRDVAPILITRCLTCHRPEKSKGDYRMHTFSALLKPGRSGESPIVAGRPDASPLVRLLEAPDPDDRMPQDGEPLTPAEIRTIRRWIEGGARPGTRPQETPLASLANESGSQPAPPERYPQPVPIHALAFRPDGKQLAAGGYHEVNLWDPGTGALLRRIPNVARQVQQIAFRPGSEQIAIAAGTPGRRGELKLFSTTDGTLIQTLATSGDLMTTVAFSPNGQRLAAGGAENAVLLFDVSTGKSIARCELNADWVMQVAFSPDGQHVVVASRDKTVRVIKSGTGELEETYAFHSDPAFAALFTEDNARVLSAGRGRTVHLWQAGDAKKLSETGPAGAEILRLALSKTGLVGGMADGEIRQYNLESKKVTTRGTLGRHGDALSGLTVHADSGTMATSGYDGLIRIWDLESGKLKREFPAHPGWKGAPHRPP